MLTLRLYPAKKWINDYAEHLIALGLEELQTNDMIHLYTEFNKMGKRYMDQIRADIDEFVSIEEDLLVQRVATQEKIKANLVHNYKCVTLLF